MVGQHKSETWVNMLQNVQYELTEHGDTLQTIITNLTDWGIVHRKKIVGK